MSRLNRLHEWERLSAVDVRRLQEERLKRLLIHAHTHSPYYQRTLEDAGVIPSSGSPHVALNQFSQVAFLDKRILLERRDDLIANRSHTHERTYWNTSGGSTGEPARFLQDAEYKDWTRAKKLLFAEWAGKPVGARELVLWVSGRVTGRPGVASSLTNFVLNKRSLSALRMTPEVMRDYVREINHFRPVYILAYVESLYDLARFVEEEGVSVWSPRSIMTSAGTLFPHIRETIERVFRAPVFNRYGSREVGDIASECDRHRGLHICPLTHYIEIVRPNGTHAQPGEIGEIVVTLLINESMPLIRYRIGDMGAWASDTCACGRSWPLLQEVTGRVTDSFVRRDGTRIYGGYFRRLFYFQDWVQRFQCVQEDYDCIRLVVVPRVRVADPEQAFVSERGRILKAIRDVMGDTCRVEWEFVDNIRPSASGKYRYTISKVGEHK